MGTTIMAEVSLKLVHSRSLLGLAEDFAATLLLSVTGLAAQFAFIAAGVVVLN
jgi:hypothetical protein